MTKKRANFQYRRRQPSSIQGDCSHLAKLQGYGCDTVSQYRQVMIERTSDFLHQTVFGKTLQQRRSRHVVHRKDLLKILVAKSRNMGTAIDNWPKQLQVGFGKRDEAVKAEVDLSIQTLRFVQVAHRIGLIVDGCYEIKTPVFGSKKKPSQKQKAVDQFFQRHHLSHFAARSSVSLSGGT